MTSILALEQDPLDQDAQRPVAAPRASMRVWVQAAWGAGADTPNYNLTVSRASLAHSGKGYCAITCRYIQMTEQLRLLYQLQGNCSHSAERLALCRALPSPRKCCQ